MSFLAINSIALTCIIFFFCFYVSFFVVKGVHKDIPLSNRDIFESLEPDPPELEWSSESINFTLNSVSNDTSTTFVSPSNNSHNNWSIEAPETENSITFGLSIEWLIGTPNDSEWTEDPEYSQQSSDFGKFEKHVKSKVHNFWAYLLRVSRNATYIETRDFLLSIPQNSIRFSDAFINEDFIREIVNLEESPSAASENHRFFRLYSNEAEMEDTDSYLQMMCEELLMYIFDCTKQEHGELCIYVKVTLHPPMSPRLVNLPKLQAYESLLNETDKGELDCTICIESGAKWHLPCNHFFHKSCLLKWFSYGNYCPNCLTEFQI